MSNLVQCLRCKQNFIKEEYDQHVCASNTIKGVKDIEVLQWWETKNEYGERVAFGLGSDGYDYRMREVKEGFVEIDPTNRHLTRTNDQPKNDQNLFCGFWVIYET